MRASAMRFVHSRARREIDTKKASEPLTLTHRKMQCIGHAVSTRFYDDW